MKIKVGIVFGGSSREREISFAGGRTVYDNLNKTLFEPIPLFIDSFNNFILLDWKYIYKGSIRDFYPPVDFLPESLNMFQVYAESLGNLTQDEQQQMIEKTGRKVQMEELNELIDFAFLCLHGINGEDGRIQGLLEWMGIPYSGSGILSSTIGMDKATQKDLMIKSGFESPEYVVLQKQEWLSAPDQESIFKQITRELKSNIVIKPANQGSSIGITILSGKDFQQFKDAVDKGFFMKTIASHDWNSLNDVQKVEKIRSLADIREGIGLPVTAGIAKHQQVIFHPEHLLKFLNSYLASDESVTLTALDRENELLIEQFIEGKEFSCIVIRNIDGTPVALPPTEIRKGKELFDYRSKYLPGLSRKITPIQLPDKQLQLIRNECERLFTEMRFNVYARIDGFVNAEGNVFLNDPNTTSGMMPSSFFFHQAAEIGLNPSQFITYIIRTSLEERKHHMRDSAKPAQLLKKLDNDIEELKNMSAEKKKIAVIMGGFSSERHISVESGRNIYEKLSSSEKYEPITVFLSGNSHRYTLYQIPVNILLKDNADDIREKTENFELHPVLQQIVNQCKPITQKYSTGGIIIEPRAIEYNELAEMVDGVFIALHGRPGEDGEVQQKLEAFGIPYNGSGVESSRVTINKYNTNEVLRQNGLLIPKHKMVYRKDWEQDPVEFIKDITSEFSFPFIAKPVDDGCSSAVKKIKSEEELIAFAGLMYRITEELPAQEALFLKVKPKEEFPIKDVFLIEELVSKGNAKHFLEITGGLLTHVADNGDRIYEIFEPSEALSEGDVLSLEEKFLAGQGQNITPARFSNDKVLNDKISAIVRVELEKAAKILNIEGYARIDAFVRIYEKERVEVIFIEVNSLPGMTPATCIFHQTAINGYKPYDFIDNILEYGFKRKQSQLQKS
jgi:UDP-N-acetylmuramate--alanine ligase